jgi:hypothetical protein
LFISNYESTKKKTQQVQARNELSNFSNPIEKTVNDKLSGIDACFSDCVRHIEDFSFRPYFSNDMARSVMPVFSYLLASNFVYVVCRISAEDKAFKKIIVVVNSGQHVPSTTSLADSHNATPMKQGSHRMAASHSMSSLPSETSSSSFLRTGAESSNWGNNKAFVPPPDNMFASNFKSSYRVPLSLSSGAQPGTRVPSKLSNTAPRRFEYF